MAAKMFFPLLNNLSTFWSPHKSRCALRPCRKAASCGRGCCFQGRWQVCRRKAARDLQVNRKAPIIGYSERKLECNFERCARLNFKFWINDNAIMFVLRCRIIGGEEKQSRRKRRNNFGLRSRRSRRKYLAAGKIIAGWMEIEGALRVPYRPKICVVLLSVWNLLKATLKAALMIHILYDDPGQNALAIPHVDPAGRAFCPAFAPHQLQARGAGEVASWAGGHWFCLGHQEAHWAEDRLF